MGLPEELVSTLSGTYWQQAMPGDYAVLGDPIGHSWSPRIHAAAYKACGLDLIYRAIHVPAEEFSEALPSLARLGYKGANITLPLKELAYQWADHRDDECARFGAANTVDLTTGKVTNTDGRGFLEAIGAAGISPPGPVLLLGAGGTAQALATVLADAGYELRIHNRTRSKAADLAVRVGATLLDHPDVAGTKLVVNATSAGLSGEPLDIAWGTPVPGAVVMDVLYGHEPTPLLADAAQAGYQTMDGRHMLVAQAALSFEWWLGIPAPREAMFRALEGTE